MSARFDLNGVSSSLQLGRRGSRVVQSGGVIKFRNAADSADANITAAAGTYTGNVTLDGASSKLFIGDGLGNPDLVFRKVSSGPAEFKYETDSGDGLNPHWVHAFDSSQDLLWQRRDSFGVTVDTPLRLDWFDGNAYLANAIALNGRSTSDAISWADNLVLGALTGNHGLAIISATTGIGTVSFQDNVTATTVGRISYDHNQQRLEWVVENTERMILDASGDLIIDGDYSGVNADLSGFLEVVGGSNANAAAAQDDITMGNFTGSVGMQLQCGSSATANYGVSDNNTAGEWTGVLQYRFADELWRVWVEKTTKFDITTTEVRVYDNLQVDGQAFFGDATDTVSSNAVTLDFDAGNTLLFDMQPSTGAVTATLSNMRSGGTYYAVLLQGSGLDSITFSGVTIKWDGGTQPGVIGYDNRYQIYEFRVVGSLVFAKLVWQDVLSPG